MSKTKEKEPVEEAGYGTGSGDPGGQAEAGGGEESGNNSDSPAGGESPGGEVKAAGPQTLPAEEHAKEAKTPASVFAAVMQAQGWAAGKKVTAEEYKKAVEAFLGAPMGGEKPPEKLPEGEKK
jgi:hypothetical protein